MNTFKKIFLSGVLVLVILALATGCQPARETPRAMVDDAVDAIFRDAEAPVDPAGFDGALKRRYVHVDFSALEQKLRSAERVEMRLPLFGDKVVSVVLDEVQDIAYNNLIAIGHIRGEPESDVSIVVNDGVLIATIRDSLRSEGYSIRFVKDGVHAIEEIDTKNEGECESIEEPEPMNEESAEALASPMAVPVIDVLVAYTPKARAAQGGTTAMKALIQKGIADTNRAFVDSGVVAQVRLVGTLETRQSESTSLSNDLYALRSKTDGKFDEVHSVRDRVGADQVSLIGAYSTTASPVGIAYSSMLVASSFAVTKASAFSQYTFTHELGHNIGLLHSDGYENSAGRFRTIMAYGTYTRVRRFSNPNYPYSGYRTGTSTANSAAKLNRNAPRVAGLKASIVRTSLK